MKPHARTRRLVPELFLASLLLAPTGCGTNAAVSEPVISAPLGDEQRLDSPNPAPAPPMAEVYLPPEQTGGYRYCLDPDSAALAASLGQLRQTLTEPLDRAALAADVDFFHQLLRELYSGYPELVQHPTFEVEAFFARWTESLRRGTEPAFLEPDFSAWLVELGADHSDRHLMPIGAYEQVVDAPAAQVHELVGALPEGASALDLGGCRLHALPGDVAIHWAPGTLRTAWGVDAEERVGPVLAVSVRGEGPERAELRCGEQRVALERRPWVFARDEGPVYEWRAHGDTAIIRIRRFWGDAEELATLGELARDYEQHRSFARIVFDVRGNSGGDDSYLFDWIAAAKRGVWSTGVIVNLDTNLGPCRGWNPLVVDQLLDGRANSTQAQAERAELRASWSAADGARSGTLLRVHDGLVEGEAEHPYAGSIVVLTDRDTASSGESVPAYLRAALGARVIGERSAGLMDYGNVLPFVLPHTGVWVQIPTTRFYNDPPAEVIGVPVDAYLAPELMERPAEALIGVLDELDRELPAG